jgi:hypothetical protein
MKLLSTAFGYLTHLYPSLLAYTYYAFFEWSLIVSDLLFDAVTLLDFKTFEFRIVDMGRNEGSNASHGLKTYGGNKGSSGGFKPFEIISFASDVYLGKYPYFFISCDVSCEPFL